MMEMQSKGLAKDLDSKPVQAEEHSPGDPDASSNKWKKRQSLWQGWEGSSVMALGVAIPALLIAVVLLNSCNTATEMVLRHPLETLIQFALVLSIPLGNLIVWRQLQSKNVTKVARLGITNGLSIGSAFSIAVACLAASILGYPAIDEANSISHAQDAISCAFVSFTALIISLYLLKRLRQSWETRGAQNQQLMCSLTGIVLSLLTIGISEARSLVIRINEQQAVNGTPSERKQALGTLRLLGGEHELRMDINDPRSGGLSGMFMRSDQSARKQLYFTLCAKPYQALQDMLKPDEAATSNNVFGQDSYLASHVVGDALPGLSLVRSQLSGAVNARALTSKLDWTFVFKNKNYADQEARAEIALPPGAVVSGMTLWMNGEPKEASIGATEQAEAAYRWIVASKRDPALLQYLGKGKVLMQCFPVPANKELKLQISMTAPMKLDVGTEASLTLPRLLSSNFAKPKSESIRLSSADNLSLPYADLHALHLPAGEQIFTGKVDETAMSKSALSIAAFRPMSVGAFAAADRRSGGYAVESVKELENTVPKHLVVVIDGSEAIKPYAHDLSNMLRTVAKSIPTSAIIVDSDKEDCGEPLTATVAAKHLADMQFEGGHDNLPAVLKAAEVAGDTEEGAVLWVHGPQPGFNEEIYITSKFVSKPEFFELALDDDSTNVASFFRNHREIGPLNQVTRNGNLESDLKRFLAQWQPGGKHYSVQLAHLSVKPKCPILIGPESDALVTLCATNSCKQFIAQHKLGRVAKLASDYHIVTPVTAAVVLERASDYQRFGLQERRSQSDTQTLASNDSMSGFGGSEMRSDEETRLATLHARPSVAFAPQLQGATNGTLGPQGADATYITGLNTSGSLRVNNLANLEAMLNIFANAAELLGICVGTILLVRGLTQYRIKLAVLASSIIVLGLAIPGTINWLVASARDSNLFN